MRRRLLAVGAVVALAVGVLAALEPGLLRLQEWFVAAVGVLALVLALVAVRERLESRDGRAETPDPELAQPLPAPGDDFEATLGAFTGKRHTGHLRSLHEGLREAATAVLTRYGGVTAEDARDSLQQGTWTEDAVAARMLRPTRGRVGVFGNQLRARLGGETPHERRIRRTVDAIVDLVDRPDLDLEGGAEPPADADSFVATVTPGPDTERETGHWRAVGVLALVAVGLGTLFERPSVVLAATVGFGYAAYARASAPPAIDLAIERDLVAAEGATPATEPSRGAAPADGGATPSAVADGGTGDVTVPPEARVSVSVTVRNDGGRTLPDLRLIDGVPAALRVVEGNPRLATALRPGETATLTYAVESRRGVHEFGPTLALARDLAGTHERERRFPAGGSVTCIPPIHSVGTSVPLREQGTRYAGQVSTGSGGEGIEFHATREYRPGDPPGRIDWNRRARTGELSTVEYREERAATVVVVVDARPAAHVAPAMDEPSAVDRSVDAAGRLCAALLDSGNRVGLAALGPEELWVPPASGRDHRTRLRRVLATSPVLAPVPPTERTSNVGWRWLDGRLPQGAQVLLLSPLVDGYAATAARWLEVRHHPVTVVSPDATGTETPGRRLARVGRAIRMTDLRSAGVSVVDWPRDSRLTSALASTDRGQSS